MSTVDELRTQIQQAAAHGHAGLARGLAARLDAIIDAKIAAGRAMTRAELESRPLPVRLRDGLTRLLSPYL